MGELANIANNLVQPITKLIECASTGIGIAYQPRLVRKMADARRYEINQISQAIRENCDVLGTYTNNGIEVSLPEFTDFLKRAEYRKRITEIKEQQNIENVLDETAQLLEGTATVTSEPVDEDWLNRFFNSVKEISNEDMQIIWARILAEEIKSPNTCSFRTLETLRNMTRVEAELFQKISRCTIQSGRFRFLPQYKSYLEKEKINYEEIIKLSEHGLISTNGMESINTTFEEESIIYTFNAQVVMLVKKRPGQVNKLTVPSYTLTTVGKEISNLFENEISTDSLLEFAQCVKRENMPFVISVFPILKRDENAFTYDDRNDLLMENNA